MGSGFPTQSLLYFMDINVHILRNFDKTLFRPAGYLMLSVLVVEYGVGQGDHSRRKSGPRSVMRLTIPDVVSLQIAGGTGSWVIRFLCVHFPCASTAEATHRFCLGALSETSVPLPRTYMLHTITYFPQDKTRREDGVFSIIVSRCTVEVIISFVHINVC